MIVFLLLNIILLVGCGKLSSDYIEKPSVQNVEEPQDMKKQRSTYSKDEVIGIVKKSDEGWFKLNSYASEQFDKVDVKSNAFKNALRQLALQYYTETYYNQTIKPWVDEIWIDYGEGYFPNELEIRLKILKNLPDEISVETIRIGSLSGGVVGNSTKRIVSAKKINGVWKINEDMSIPGDINLTEQEARIVLRNRYGFKKEDLQLIKTQKVQELLTMLKPDIQTLDQQYADNVKIVFNPNKRVYIYKNKSKSPEDPAYLLISQQNGLILNDIFDASGKISAIYSKLDLQ